MHHEIVIPNRSRFGEITDSMDDSEQEIPSAADGTDGRVSKSAELSSSNCPGTALPLFTNIPASGPVNQLLTTVQNAVCTEENSTSDYESTCSDSSFLRHLIMSPRVLSPDSQAASSGGITHKVCVFCGLNFKVIIRFAAAMGSILNKRSSHRSTFKIIFLKCDSTVFPSWNCFSVLF